MYIMSSIFPIFNNDSCTLCQAPFLPLDLASWFTGAFVYQKMITETVKYTIFLQNGVEYNTDHLTLSYYGSKKSTNNMIVSSSNHS
jgi:hypothetical protein